MKQFLFKKEALLLVVTLCLGIIILISFLFIRGPKKQISQSPSPTQSSNIPSTNLSITKTEPTNNSFLPLNKPFSLKIFLSKPINLADLKISLTRLDVTKDTPPLDIDFESSLSSDKSTLTIQSSDPVNPYVNYQLTILDSKTEQVLLKNSFSSDFPDISPAPKNNLSLIQYLPHETPNYILSYNKDKNSYIFNFKFDLNNPESGSDQFEKAKSEAIKFIESKSIDIQSLVIEYNHS